MTDENETQQEEAPDPGIFVTKGMKITIPSFSIRIKDDGTVESDPVTLHTGLDMCPYWLEIALKRLAESETAHALLMEGKATSDDDKISRGLRDDFMAGMESIMASAISIDAYYAGIKDRINLPPSLITSWKDNGTARYKQITEVFRRAFKLPQGSAGTLREILKQIFQFRDRAVHPEAGTTAPALHPELNKVSDWRYAAFRNYNAKAIAKATLSVVDQTSTKGNAANQALDTYCKDVATRIEPLIADWKATYGTLYE